MSDDKNWWVNRERRQWWAVTAGGVKHVTCLSCGPNLKGVWWCPETGVSLTENKQLFQTKSEAIEMKKQMEENPHLGHMLTNEQAAEISRIVSESRTATERVNRLKDTLEGWREQLEAKGMNPHFLAYYIEYRLAQQQGAQ